MNILKKLTWNEAKKYLDSGFKYVEGHTVEKEHDNCFFLDALNKTIIRTKQIILNTNTFYEDVNLIYKFFRKNKDTKDADHN